MKKCPQCGTPIKREQQPQKNILNKILVVDDDFAIRLLYQEELKEDGYTVTVTDDCRNLMTTIEAFGPDLIVLDIMMGEFNGLDLLQGIRKKYYDLPVVLCSAYSHFKYDLRSIAADYYVTKSADLTQLKYMIKLALENRYSDQEFRHGGSGGLIAAV